MSTSQKSFLLAVLIILFIILAGVFGYLASYQNGFGGFTPSPIPIPYPIPVPGPDPVPTPGPTPTPQTETVTVRVGGQEGSFLVQKINTDSVDGLWYMAYPVPRDIGIPKTLHIGDDIGYACEGVSEKLSIINTSSQTITFVKTTGEPTMGGCPICLSGKTHIDTPKGTILVKDLQIGMPIWTVDTKGNRITGTVKETSRVPVPPTHQMVHLVFEDGRELFVSPGHPTTDGRHISDLTANELYDGSVIVSINHTSYDEGATYDILPSGETGFYWANGILIGSTLHSR
ncbi:MAG: hypothetical protein WCG84_00640 [Candidatus Moraniibacteriota bacterium]